MAFSGIGKLIKDLVEQTSIADADCFAVGTDDIKRITWANVIAAIKAKLGGAATKAVANNLTTSAAGTSVLDAYQGKLLKDQLDEQNTKIAYEYQYILVGEINIGQAQKFGRIVELDLSNLTVASGTTENDLLFTLASSYAPKNQVDFCDTYGNVRFRIDTAGNAKLTATINEKSFLRGTFMYISAS